jgi:uncharacterized protein with PQ loop repeat
MCFMWAPQIYHTFKLKDVGSLSILTLMIQGPGSIAVVVTMILDKQTFFATLPFVASAICILTLLVECIYFELKNRRRLAQLREDNFRGLN